MSDTGTEANDQIDAETTETVEAPDKTTTQETAQPSEVEARARRMGWHSKEEMEAGGRDVSKYVDPEEYIRRGEENLPILKERLRKADERQSKLEGKLDEGHKLLRDLVARQSEREKKAAERAVAALKTERREAARIGDDDKVEALSDEIAREEKALEAIPEPKVETRKSEVEAPPEIAAWVSANSWFDSDPVARQAAIGAYTKVATAEPSLTETQRLAKVRSEIVKRFPEHFTNPNRTKAAAVEGGGKQARTNGKGWDDIPAEDRALAERLIRNGAVKDKAAYLKDYFSA